MQNEEQLRKEQISESQKKQFSDSQEIQKNDWRMNLRNFFDKVEHEDKVFADYVTQIAHFYADTARPALAEVSRELKLYGRDCETGEDAGRVYIIVRAGDEKVEFQYAVVAEAKIEGAIPYIHCWYEESDGDAAENAQQNSDQKNQSEENSADDDDENDEQSEDENDDQKKDNDEESDEKSGDEKSSAAPKRIKTIEILNGWNKERKLQSITREEIISDFVAHYQNAVGRLRAPLHIAPEEINR